MDAVRLTGAVWPRLLPYTYNGELYDSAEFYYSAVHLGLANAHGGHSLVAVRSSVSPFEVSAG